jgi:hypothetical protein
MGAKALEVRCAVDAPGPDDSIVLGHHHGDLEMGQRGEQLSLGEIPGRLEQDQHVLARYAIHSFGSSRA